MENSAHYFYYSDEDFENLKKKDIKLAHAMEKIHERKGKLQIPVTPNLFIAILQSIVGQQISIKAQKTIWARFVQKVNQKKTQAISTDNNINNENLDIEVQHILSLDIEEVKSCGMSYKKAEYLLDFARNVHNGACDLDKLHAMSNEEVITNLTALKGIGKWTAEMMMLFSMQRTDIISFGDLGIIKGLRILYQNPALVNKISKTDCKMYEEKFMPYGSLASLYLWQISNGVLADLPEYTDPLPAKKAQ